jgi:hypothetical protein
MNALARRLPSALVAVLALLPGVSTADHFNGNPADGDFSPEMTVSLLDGALPGRIHENVVSRPVEVDIDVQQADHEDPSAFVIFHFPGQWQFPFDQILPAQFKAGWPTDSDTKKCEATMSGLYDSPDNTGITPGSDTSKRTNAKVETGEIFGSIKLLVQSDVVSRPGNPIEYNGDLWFVSWDGSTGQALLCLLLITRDTRVTGLADTSPNGCSGTAPRQRCDDIEGVTELVAGFPLTRKTLADGRLVWEVVGDFTGLVKNSTLQSLNVSALELKTTWFAHSKGNWDPGGIDFSVTPPTQGTYAVEGIFTTCPAADPSYRMCKSNKGTKTITVPVTIFNVIITNPKNGSTETSKDVQVTGLTEPVTQVKVFEGSAELAQVTSGSGGSWSKTIHFDQDGAHEIFARSSRSDAASNLVAFIISAFSFVYDGSYLGSPASLFINPISGVFRFEVHALDTPDQKFVVQDFATLMQFFPGETPREGRGFLFHLNRAYEPVPPSWTMTMLFDTSLAVGDFYGDRLLIPFVGLRRP